MTICNLFSGSRGNATLVSDGETEILIDCGKSARAVCRALAETGHDIKNVSAVLVTHEHSDHTSALEVLCRQNAFPVHVFEKSAPKLNRIPYISSRLVIHDNVCFTAEVGSLIIKSFPLPHDSAANLGYVIESSHGGTFGIATDMGHVTPECVESLSGCECVLIEANHDVDMLRSGRYPAELKRRILSKKGHLSNEDCGSLACTLADAGCRLVALGHLSPENNLPEIAFSEVRRALDSAGHESVELIVTDRERPTVVETAGGGILLKNF